MGLLDGLLNNETVKKQLFSKMAKTAKENGFSQVLIKIGDNGEFDAQPFAENEKVLITKQEHDFLISFYEKNKPTF